MNKKTIVVGITSSIAAFKVIELIADLKKDGNEVIVIMTEHARQMIDPGLFEKVSGNNVHTHLFEKGFDYKKILKDRQVDHIEIADKADIFVVVPATANIIGKISHGIADDFLTTSILATKAHRIICPAMNINMWSNPFVTENVTKLKNSGFQIIEPAEGMLACGYTGTGKLEAITKIKEEIDRWLKKSNSLKGKKIIITAGGTTESIDGVRTITNRSSGKMGIALAEESYLRGADVLLLAAKTSVAPSFKIKSELFSTTEDLLQLIKNNVHNYDYIFHSAAVADFKPQKTVKGKISSKNLINLKLIPQIKISDQIKKINPHVKLIIFKAEYGLTDDKLILMAKNKLKESLADLIIANDISSDKSGFETDYNEIFMISYNGRIKKIPYNTKKEIARQILDFTSLNLSS